jgi:Fur family transcriptional regulator, peroxide stress response regulator
MRDPKEVLSAHKLKVTPQRIAVLEALYELKDHPTADRIIDRVKIRHPHIAGGTVYRTLDSLAQKGIIQRVKSDRDVIRFDEVMQPHHHYYCTDSDEILDYFDNGLTDLLSDYFRQHGLPGFSIEDIRVQVSGRFKPKEGETESANCQEISNKDITLKNTQ